MFHEMSNKELYNHIFWMLRCWKRETKQENKMWWGKELNEMRIKHTEVFHKANTSFWNIN